jgi:hypothetical protein
MLKTTVCKIHFMQESSSFFKLNKAGKADHDSQIPPTRTKTAIKERAQL